MWIGVNHESVTIELIMNETLKACRLYESEAHSG